MLERRRMLSLLGSGALVLTGCTGADTSPDTTVSDSSGDTGSSGSGSGGGTGGGSESSADCVAYSEETNGPYPADGSNSARGAVANVLIDSGIVRSDMRSSFAGLSGEAEGVLMELSVRVVDVNNTCAALENYAIYIWHCDAEGSYSVYDLSDQNYLRAVGVTDANGEVSFTTIFPGCYSGRWPHIHFEIYKTLDLATHYGNRILCSQMAMPADECSHVYNVRDDYGNSGSNFVSLSIARDNVFGDNSDEEIEAQTLTMSGDTVNGYTASVTVGLSL
jgi:protocatechuate 3,4-dioxygenase beta subunit